MAALRSALLSVLPALVALGGTPGTAVAADPLPGPVAPPADSPHLAAARSLSAAFEELAAAVADATVYIEARKGPTVAAGLGELMRDYQLPGLQPGEGGPLSTGSGVIISPDGLVLTNNHVIAGSAAPMITLRDQRRYPAEVIGADPRTDLAVLRILGEGPHPWAELGDSDAARVGQWVVAIGHPFEFQFTVTTGIISARGRRNLFRSEIQDYLQIDAAVNPGSSGGPLFDLDGRVIGINTAIYTPSGEGGPSAGISFAIPSNMARKVKDELLANGRVGRATLGLSTRDAPATPARPRPGAEITRVAPRSPAEAGGLRRGDVIVGVDGEAIADSADLRGLVQARGVDSALEVEYLRDGVALVARLRTGDEERLGQPGVPAPPDATEWAGMTLGPLTDAARAAFALELPPDAVGVVIYAVLPGSPAAVAGLEPGDVLVEALETRLADPAALPPLAQGRRTLLVRFWRDGGEAWAALAGLGTYQR